MPLGFGIIGCGSISHCHAGAILQIPAARLVGVTDINETTRLGFAEKYQTQAFGSVDELLANPSVDVVCICTPSGLHASLAIQAAERSKHLVIEKPMATSLQDARQIIAACDRNQVKVQVIFQLRFSEAVKAVKSALDSNWLGRLVLGGISMKFHRSQEYYQTSSWRGTWEFDGGGALMNQGIHSIDLLLYLMGPVRSVSAYTGTLARKIETEDTAVVSLQFASGALGVIEATTCAYPGLPRRLDICGDHGTISLESDRLAYWQVEGRDIPGKVPLGHSNNSSANSNIVADIEGHRQQISDLIEAITNNRDPAVNQDEGIKSIELISAIYESARTGLRVIVGDRQGEIQ